MQEFQIELTDTQGHKLLLEAVHDGNLGNRSGYDKNFLGAEVPLPTLGPGITDTIGTNPSPSANGADYLDYTHFSVLFNKSKKLPFATAVNIQGDTNELGIVHETRDGDSWYPDQRLLENGNNHQFGNADYSHSGFQKGHMVRYYDPAWGDSMELKKRAIGDTFHFTNCCPQLSGLNVGNWLDLENYAMARALFQDKKVTVFAGPVFNKALPIGNLLVPVSYWKIIVYKKGDGIEAQGFLLSQEVAYTKMLTESLITEQRTGFSNPTLTQADIDRLFTTKNLKGYMVKIALLEEKTGLRFGLNEVDLNREQPQLFFEKLSASPLPAVTERFKGIVSYIENDFYEEGFDDEAFIRGI